MELIKELIVNLIGSSFILALFLFISKKYFEKWISVEFDKRAKISSSKIDQSFKVSNDILQKETGIYPEILEVTYRLRNIMRDGMVRSHAYDWNPELKPLCAHLTENLFKYRLFISEEIFDALHRFKQVAQDALIFYDVQTRDEKLFDIEEYRKRLKEFQPKYKEADELYALILKLIRQKLNSIIKT